MVTVEDAVALVNAVVTTLVDLALSSVALLLVAVLGAQPDSWEHLPFSSRGVNRTLLQTGNFWLLLPLYADNESRDLFFSWRRPHQSPHTTQSEGLP